MAGEIFAFANLLASQTTRRLGAVAFWDSGVAGQETLASSNPDAARVVNALFADHPWDTAFMAGKQLPGFCEVTNGLTEIGIDMKKPDGADGSTITVKGYRPGKFEIACTVWTSDQWVTLQDIIALVWRRPKKKSKLAQSAFEVHHPSLQLLGVNSCVVQAVTYPQPGKFEGSKVVVFKCVENVPAGRKRVVKTANNVSVDKVVAKPTAESPHNETPAKPSTLKSETSPVGPRSLPMSGGY